MICTNSLEMHKTALYVKSCAATTTTTVERSIKRLLRLFLTLLYYFSFFYNAIIIMISTVYSAHWAENYVIQILRILGFQ